MNVLQDTEPVARKHYSCAACHVWLLSNYGQADLSPDDWLIVEGAMADFWKIKPGQKYRKIVYKDGADLITIRARLDMDGLCQRLELFDD